MRKKRILLCLFAFGVLICGCYESKYSLSSPENARIDERLIKGWEQQTGAIDEKPHSVFIRKFNEKEYLVAFKDDNSTSTLARAFATTIDNATILNMNGIESLDLKDRTFVYFKYDFAPNGNLRAWMIADNSTLLKDKSFSSQISFYTFIKKNVHNEKLYMPVREFKPAEGMSLKIMP